MSTLVGMTLSGRYRLEELIGAGGMSTVYRAVDATLEREVAIKLMHREIAADSDQLERFRREARSVAQLSHPHIVGVIDAAEDEGRPYIVLEYVQGETLKDRIRRGQLPATEAVAYAIEIAYALSCAHQRQIVHRDVKPQNVLIDAEGSAKVTDFGIARSMAEEGLTADGRVVGTTDYVSPEQALGHPVTGQSDLYSLGVVLYEMLTGEVPFRGENQVAVAMKHVRESVPDVQLRRPGLSAATALVVDRATAKDVARRYADADEMLRDLEQALAVEAARGDQTTIEATGVLRTLPEPARRRLPSNMRRPAWLVGLALLVAGGVTAALLAGLSERAQRGTGPPRERPPAGLQALSLGQKAAHDFDPFGGDGEHPEQTSFVLDRDPETTWSTERYSAGLNKPGVGIYVDAKPRVAAVALQVRTTEAGWTGEVYGAERGPPEQLSGWTKLAGPLVVSETRARFPLQTGGRAYRFYLVWITKLSGQGEGLTTTTGTQQSVFISDITLYRRGPARP